MKKIIMGLVLVSMVSFFGCVPQADDKTTTTDTDNVVIVDDADMEADSTETVDSLPVADSTETVEVSEPTVDQIKEALLAKDQIWDFSNPEIFVDITKVDGDYASGGVGGPEGGGYWFAVKTANGWVIAADGNGVILCEDIDAYDFPADMISECYDTEKADVRIR